MAKIKNPIILIGSQGEGGAMPTLETPIVTENGLNNIKFSNPTSNGDFAEGYKIYYNGELKETKESTGNIQSHSFDYNLRGTYDLTVSMYGTNFNDSPQSEPITCGIYTKTLQLTGLGCTEQASAITRGMNLSEKLWVYTGRYLPRTIEITVDDQPIPFYYNNKTGEYKIASAYTTGNVKIKAIGSTQKLLDSPKVTLSSSTISWSAITDATTYSIRSSGVEIANTTNLTYDLSTLCTADNIYKITVIAQAENCRESDADSIIYYVVGNAPIYSVSGEGASSPSLTRGDSAVGLTYTKEIDGRITSDFDNCLPWCAIKEVKDSADNVFIRIPKHYTRYTFIDGLKKTEISATKRDDTWLLNPIFTNGSTTEYDYVDIAKYLASSYSSPVKSKKGVSPRTNITIANMRTACANNGTGYQQMDIWAWTMLQDLFKVEFATTDCQSVMEGYSSGNLSSSSGNLDFIFSTSGCFGGGINGMKYRGIEHLWGNVLIWIDGIKIESTGEYKVCKDPTKYGTASEYESLGYNGTSGNGYTKKLGYIETNPFAPLPTDGSGTDSTYYCDYFYRTANYGGYLSSSGHWAGNELNGLWKYSFTRVDSTTSTSIGGRIVKRGN